MLGGGGEKRNSSRNDVEGGREEEEVVIYCSSNGNCSNIVVVVIVGGEGGRGTVHFEHERFNKTQELLMSERYALPFVINWWSSQSMSQTISHSIFQQL